jgi:hypothetical protein
MGAKLLMVGRISLPQLFVIIATLVVICQAFFQENRVEEPLSTYIHILSPYIQHRLPIHLEMGCESIG